MASSIYNAWLDKNDIDTGVMPMGAKAADYVSAVKTIRRFSNFHGALVTTPHKVTTVSLMSGVTPGAQIAGGSNDPAGYNLIVNATPMGRNVGDPLPIDVSRIAPHTFGEVVMKQPLTPLLAAARAKDCVFQEGAEMLLEQIAAHLKFVGSGPAAPDEFRAVAQTEY